MSAIEVTEAAYQRIADIAKHLDELQDACRRDEAKYLATAASFAQAMTRVFGLLSYKGGRIVADNDTGSLSLGVDTPHIYCGVVFFPTELEKPARVEGNRTVICARHGVPWPAQPAYEMHCPMLDTQTNDYCGLRVDIPMSGTWSLHS